MNQRRSSTTAGAAARLLLTRRRHVDLMRTSSDLCRDNTPVPRPLPSGASP